MNRVDQHSGADRNPPSIADYELLRLIGHGSYGDVWLARGVTGAWRAIKVVWRERFTDTTPFEREFRGLTESMEASPGESIQMALLHVGRNDAAGFFYYVMELADDAGDSRVIDPESYVPLTLAELRRRHERLPAGECVRLGVELARALAGLHQRGLVHRDIKPSNVILVGGVPKLADVGLVAPAASARTYVGTDGYVPPEGPGAPSADVFALGKVLYELSTGLDRQEFPQLPPELDQLSDHQTLFALNAVILRACDAEPAKRYRDGKALLADLSALQTGRSPVRPWTGAWILRTALAVVLLGLCAAGGYAWRMRSSATTLAADAAARTVSGKSIAVLPFANMSDEKDANAFFADGIHEDILTNLARIAELRVVSHSTVMAYRDTTKPGTQIGAELGVAYLLEGSVRRAGNRVRVTGQLVNARTNEQVWANSYDRDLTDIFAIQKDLAQEIAGALSAVISPETRRQLERPPTGSSSAYDLYLQARNIRNRSYTESLSGLDQTEKLLTDALKIDPDFAVARGELALVHAKKIFWGQDCSADQYTRAKEAMAAAVRLAPKDPEVIRQSALFAYLAYRDYDRATAIFEDIIRQQPNDPAGYGFLALIQRRQGRKAESLRNLQHAVELDPGNITYLKNLRATQLFRRQWPEMLATQRRIMALLPGSLQEEFVMAEFSRLATASFQPQDDLLARLTATQRESPLALYWRKSWSIERGALADFAALDRRLPYYPEAQNPADAAIDASIVYLAMGDVTAVRARLGTQLGEMREILHKQPENYGVQMQVAMMEAIAGNRDDAVRLAQSVMATMPESRDAVAGAFFRFDLTRVYAIVGDKEHALAELTRLVHAPTQTFNIAQIREDPSIRPLAADSRFAALFNDPKNNARLP